MSPEKKVFEVTAERGQGDWWVLEAPEVGAVSQVRRLDQAEEEMQEAISYLSGLSIDHVEVRLTRDGQHIASVVSAQELRRREEEREDLMNAILVLGRLLTDDGTRTDLDEALALFGLDRAELE